MSVKVVKALDIESKKVVIEGAEGASIRILISKTDGAGNFTMRMFDLEAGGHTPLHNHKHEHEVFILEGEGIFVCEGKEHPIAPDDVVFVPGDIEHRFMNTGNSTLRFLCLVPAYAG